MEGRGLRQRVITQPRPSAEVGPEEWCVWPCPIPAIHPVPDIRSGGFAPTIFPLFQGTRFETTSTMLETSVMVTSSASEAGHSQASQLLKSRRLSDD